MAPTTKLRLGNLFDGPCDLIVLPCSTDGTVTGFVAQSLARHLIPHPREGMNLGEVDIGPFEGGENLAQYVAFAASVHRNTSSTSAIESIAGELGRFTARTAGARAISVPLLGAGAGGIRSEDVVGALKSGFTSSATSDATLTVSVLHKDVYDRLRNNRSRVGGVLRQPVRTFISHTSATDDAVEWVKQLALFLIDRGVQARLDRFHLRRGMDLPQWMCNELSLAEKVILVCDESYKTKADGRLGGVGWETMVIQGDMATLPHDSTKYQIVVRSEELGSGLPVYLRTKYAFHARPSDAKMRFREELLRELMDMPLDERLEAREVVV